MSKTVGLPRTNRSLASLSETDGATRSLLLVAAALGEVGGGG